MAPKNTAATATETTATTAPAEKKFTVLSINTAIPMPVKSGGKRGSATKFPFAALPVGGSFGIVGREGGAKSMSSIISNQNRQASNQTPKLDASGNVVYKTKTVKDAEGVETAIPTTEPETVSIKEFFAVDTDPATDPEGANVRVFRSK